VTIDDARRGGVERGGGGLVELKVGDDPGMGRTGPAAG
jgi:hypothetical protein